jgi:hypothetical protein
MEVQIGPKIVRGRGSVTYDAADPYDSEEDRYFESLPVQSEDQKVLSQPCAFFLPPSELGNFRKLQRKEGA